MAKAETCAVDQQPGGPLVAAVAVGYPLATFQRFVISLRLHYGGALTLMTGDKTVARDARQLCCAHRARLISGTAHGLNLSRILGIDAKDGTVRGESRSHAAAFSRFIAYARLCSAGAHSLCLGVDFRDVIFQGDPFSWLQHRFGDATAGPPDLIIALQLNTTHASSMINRNWVRTCFDDTVAAGMDKAAVINSGTVMGSAVGLQALAAVFSTHLHRASRVRRGRGFVQSVQCNDQAMVNYAVHTRSGLLAGLNIEQQRHGDSFAASLFPFKRNPSLLRLSDSGLVLNDDGTPTPVVHQFDRLPRVRLGALQAVASQLGVCP